MTDPLTDVNPFEDLSYAEIEAELNKGSYYLPSNADLVYDFHEVMGKNINKWPPTEEEAKLCMDLIWEEKKELYNELFGLDHRRLKDDIDKRKVAKEIADLLYVGYSAAVSFGINIDQVFSEVHRSNMSKLDDNGNPIRRDDGKVLKGPNYREADLSFIV